MQQLSFLKSNMYNEHFTFHQAISCLITPKLVYLDYA